MSSKKSSLKITQAVILAGGAGTRLQPFTLKNPKPMVPVNGVPFLEHLFELLKKNYVNEIVLLIGYLGDKIKNHFGEGLRNGINIQYSHTPFKNEHGEEIKSGLRLKNAEHLLKDLFLLLYCDNYWPLQLDKLVNHFMQHKSDALITAYSNKDNSTKNNIFIGETGYVEKYDLNRQKQNLNGVDIGFFIIKKRVLKLLPKTNSQFEIEVLPKLIQDKKLSGYLSDHKYYSIGDLERVKISAKYLRPKKVIFLDRDGVINKKAPKADYIKCWEEFEFLPGSIEAVKKLKDAKYKIFLISNQAGIARGAMSEKDLKNIHKNMQKELRKHGAKIDKIYYCPHGWNENCECRKPKPGMLLQASREHLLDLTKTVFIGDDERDLEAGNAAGCKSILVDRKHSLLSIVNKLTA